MDLKRDYEGLMDTHLNDNKIIMCAMSFLDKGLHVVFVSKDFAARLKAEAIGLEAEDYENLKVAYDGIKEGPETVVMEKPLIDTFSKMESFPFKEKISQITNTLISLMGFKRARWLVLIELRKRWSN